MCKLCCTITGDIRLGGIHRVARVLTRAKEKVVIVILET